MSCVNWARELMRSLANALWAMDEVLKAGEVSRMTGIPVSTFSTPRRTTHSPDGKS